MKLIKDNPAQVFLLYEMLGEYEADRLLSVHSSIESAKNADYLKNLTQKPHAFGKPDKNGQIIAKAQKGFAYKIVPMEIKN